MKAFGEGLWMPQHPNLTFVGTHFGEPFRIQIEKRKKQSENASRNQCKTMSNFEAQGGSPKMLKCGSKARIFLNGPLQVVLRKATFY